MVENIIWHINYIHKYRVFQKKLCFTFLLISQLILINESDIHRIVMTNDMRLADFIHNTCKMMKTFKRGNGRRIFEV